VTATTWEVGVLVDALRTRSDTNHRAIRAPLLIRYPLVRPDREMLCSQQMAYAAVHRIYDVRLPITIPVADVGGRVGLRISRRAMRICSHL
jgi:hypothetical protein